MTSWPEADGVVRRCGNGGRVVDIVVMFTHPIGDSAHLKLLDLRDVQALFEAVDRNRKYLREWLPWVDGTQAPSDTETFIKMTMAQFAANSGFQAGIWAGGELAGVVGYHPVDWRNRSASLGYWLAESQQGKGLMSRAVRAVCGHAFGTFKLNRVEIAAAAENTKSRAIPDRLGFRLEGVLRQREWLYDHFVDHAIYSMLASEWKSE